MAGLEWPEAWLSLLGVVAALVALEAARRVAHNSSASSEPARKSCVVIGAGVCGIACGYQLKRKGLEFVILEKNEQLGGTWFTQRFNGVRFDSMHVQTLYSFEPMLCPPMCEGKQFLQYLVDVATKYGVLPHVRFGEAVESCAWSSARRKWTVRTSKGATLECDFVFNCNGYYDPDSPNVPSCFARPGAGDAFRGRLVHSMQLNQDKEDFAGRDVVVVGSGATAATMLPHLAKTARSVTMLQRSPSFVMQSDYGQYPLYPTVVWLYHRGVALPWQLYRFFVCVVLHGAVMFMVHVVPTPLFMTYHRFQLRWFSGLDDKAIDEHFTPRYNFGE